MLQLNNILETIGSIKKLGDIIQRFKSLKITKPANRRINQSLKFKYITKFKSTYCLKAHLDMLITVTISKILS